MTNTNKKSSTITAIIALLIISTSQVFGAVECDSINNDITSKFRLLGSWDNHGSPNYLEAKNDNVSQALINYVQEFLPESMNITSTENDYFGEDIQFNTELKNASEVYMTLVHEGAAFKNTLGYYTYDINNPPATVYDIDSLVVVFANFSQPNVVKPGDKVKLGEFPENTGIGYFIIADGWNGDTVCLNQYMVFSDSRFNTFTSKEYQQHSILLNFTQEERYLIGFEDKQRPAGDNDFNDAVFYITTSPGAIDTTDIPQVPTAMLVGDTTLCDTDALATLSIELTGKAPWTIVYNDGINDIEITGIETNLYNFETSAKGIIKLVSVKDKYKLGVADGEVNIELSSPSATINSDQATCGNNGVLVDFDGHAPYSLTYKVNGEKKAVDQILESQYEIAATNGQLIELVSMSDKYCVGVADKSSIAEIKEAPTATISGDITLCDGNISNVQVELIGEAPYTFVYTDGENQTTVTTNEKLYELSTIGFNTYSLISFSDANCSGKVSGTATITEGSGDLYVEIDAPENICFSEEITLDLLGDTYNSIEWSTEGSGTINNATSGNTTYTPAEEESGIITFFAEIGNECNVKTISKDVTIIDNLDASFSVSPSDGLMTETQIMFTPENTNYDSYEWSFGDGNFSMATIASNEYLIGGKYTVELITKMGVCTGTTSQELEVMSKDELYVPNAFNPTAMNPENQVVKVYGTNIDESGFSFRIVNRWGKTMYETNSFSEANNIGWNGVNNNNDVQQEMNVFTYILKGNFIEGESFQRTGTVTQVK